MDALFATKKAGELLRGHASMQLFVTDEGFAHLVLMKSKSELPQTVKMFAREIGAPEAFVCGAAPWQVSQEAKQFCHQIGSSL